MKYDIHLGDEKMDRLETVDDVKRALERRLRKPLYDICWQELVDRRLPNDVIDFPDSEFDYLVEQYLACEKRILEAVRRATGRAFLPGQRPREIKAHPTDDKRWEAIGLLLAHKASKQKGIRRFWEVVRAPVKDTMPWLGRWSQNQVEDVIGLIAKPALESQLVEDGDFADQEAAARAFPALLDAVASRYGWDKLEAFAFLLKKIPPKTITPGRAYVKFHPRFPALDRLVLEVDPCLQEREVLKLFRRIRKAYWDGSYRPKSGGYRLSPKLLELVKFVLEEGEGLSWRERQTKWNTRFPADHPWYYSQYTNMARDFHRSIERLLGISYKQYVKPSVTRNVTEIAQKFILNIHARSGEPKSQALQAEGNHSTYDYRWDHGEA